MLGVTLICVGKLRERYFIDAFAEYTKRLRPYCSFQCIELGELRLPDAPSEKEIAAALDKEGKNVINSMPPDAYIVALCVEGRQQSSTELARLLRERENSRKPRLCFVIGGSYGLAECVKERADLRLSMSEMTFPHHLARVMLTEQIYRGFKINEGSKYHK